MKTNRRILILGLILGLVTVFLLNGYIQSLIEVGEEDSTVYVEVLIANKTVSRNTQVSEDMFTLSLIPQEAVHPNAVLSYDVILDGVTKYDIVKGEQVLLDKIITDTSKANLSYQIPKDMRAITFSNNEISGVANYVVEGDKIDILVVYDSTVEDAPPIYTQLQNIEVIKVGAFYGNVHSDTQSVEQPGSITILVNPVQAEIVALATLNGSFHLTLRNPFDASVNASNIYK